MIQAVPAKLHNAAQRHRHARFVRWPLLLEDIKRDAKAPDLLAAPFIFTSTSTGISLAPPFMQSLLLFSN